MDRNQLARRTGRIREDITAYEVVLLTSALWFLVQCLRYLFPPLFETFQTTYGVSNTETGILFTALLIGYSTVQFPAGWLSDRIGEPEMLTFGAAGFAVASFIAAGAPTFLLLGGAAVLIGLTTGIHKTVAIPYLSRLHPERKGFAIGVMDTIGQFGGAVAPLFVAAVLASALPWNVTFLVAAVFSGALAGLFYVQVTMKTGPATTNQTENEDAGAATDVEDNTYRGVFLNIRFLLFVAVVMAYTFAWNGFTSFLPLFLIDAKSLGSETASLVYSFLFVASLSQTATGWISDRISRINILLSLLLVIVGGLTAILVVENVLGLTFLTIFIGIGFHGFRPVRDSYLMDLIPDSIRGGTLGIVRTVMTAVGGLGPATVGYVSDVAGYIYAFSLLSILLGVAVLFIVILRIA